MLVSWVCSSQADEFEALRQLKNTYFADKLPSLEKPGPYFKITDINLALAGSSREKNWVVDYEELGVSTTDGTRWKYWSYLTDILKERKDSGVFIPDDYEREHGES